MGDVAIRRKGRRDDAGDGESSVAVRQLPDPVVSVVISAAKLSQNDRHGLISRAERPHL